jgi:folate-binding protein YgfZ
VSNDNPFLSLPGAVEAVAPDAGVAAHYGRPAHEQRDLAAGRALVDLSHRAVLSVSGADRLTWIDSITSQAVTALKPGDSAETLLLDQNGRLEYAAGLVDDGDTLWMIVDRAQADGLLAWLTRMRFMLRVEPLDRTDEVAVIGSMGDPGVTAASPNGIPVVWRDPWGAVAPGGWQYARGDHPSSGWDWTETVVARSALAGIAAEHPVAGILAAEALRIAAWRPRFVTEVDERSIPHELDWLRSAVHLEKGCYRGQETVAKVHNLGHPPRRLVMLHLDGSDDVLPERGDLVTSDGVSVGTVTSVGLHHELGPIALAVVKRTLDASVDVRVLVGSTEVAAAQEIIVPADAGAVAGVPRLPRLGAVHR